MFIAHDLSVVRQVSTRTAVMYLGSIVELAPTDALYVAPAHPYSRALIAAVPLPRVPVGARNASAVLGGEPQKMLIGGEPPSALNPPSGCRFNPRCPLATDRCRTERPALREIGGGRSVACHTPLV